MSREATEVRTSIGNDPNFARNDDSTITERNINPPNFDTT